MGEYAGWSQEQLLDELQHLDALWMDLKRAGIQGEATGLDVARRRDAVSALINWGVARGDSPAR